MATKQFISLDNLSLFKDLIEQVIAEGDRPSIKAAALNGSKKLELYTIENPTAQDTPRYSITLPFTEQEIISATGKSLVWNEASGGGAKFEHVDGTLSFTGVNSGGENGVTGQLYTVKKVDNKYVGTRLNMTLNGFYYTNGANSMAFSALDEIATKRDVQGDAASKTVYTTETPGGSQDNYAKMYSFYQGSEGSSQSPVVSEKILDLYIPKDMVISEGTVVNITFHDGKLWDGQTDVTEIIKGSETPTSADAGKYIRLTVANSTNDKIYIKATDLVDVYTGGDTEEIHNYILSNTIFSTIRPSSIAKTKFCHLFYGFVILLWYIADIF